MGSFDTSGMNREQKKCRAGQQQGSEKFTDIYFCDYLELNKLWLIYMCSSDLGVQMLPVVTVSYCIRFVLLMLAVTTCRPYSEADRAVPPEMRVENRDVNMLVCVSQWTPCLYIYKGMKRIVKVQTWSQVTKACC